MNRDLIKQVFGIVGILVLQLHVGFIIFYTGMPEWLHLTNLFWTLSFILYVSIPSEAT